MKIGNRKLYYAAGGSSEYQERVEILHCYYSGKHGRYKKDKRLSKKVRHMCKHVNFDEMGCENIDDEQELIDAAFQQEDFEKLQEMNRY